MEKILFMATVQPHLRNYPNRNISEYIKNIRKYLQQKHLFLHLMYDFQKSFINVHAKKHAAGKPTHVSPPNRIPNPGMKFVVVQLFSVSNITSMADTVLLYYVDSTIFLCTRQYVLRTHVHRTLSLSSLYAVPSKEKGGECILS